MAIDRRDIVTFLIYLGLLALFMAISSGCKGQYGGGGIVDAPKNISVRIRNECGDAKGKNEDDDGRKQAGAVNVIIWGDWESKTDADIKQEDVGNPETEAKLPDLPLP